MYEGHTFWIEFFCRSWPWSECKRRNKSLIIGRLFHWHLHSMAFSENILFRNEFSSGIWGGMQNFTVLYFVHALSNAYNENSLNSNISWHENTLIIFTIIITIIMISLPQSIWMIADSNSTILLYIYANPIFKATSTRLEKYLQPNACTAIREQPLTRPTRSNLANSWKF